MAAAIKTSMLHNYYRILWAVVSAASAALLLASPQLVHAANVNLAWDRSADTNVAGYNLSYGTTSHSYSQRINAGNSNSATVSLIPGATYYFVVSAYNSIGLESSPSNEVALTMPNNAPPSVSLTSPQSNTKFKAGSSISVSARASDSDGRVVKVEFYQNSTKIGETTSAPYSGVWSNVTAGNYVLTALAYDDAGAAVRSAGIPVRVTGRGVTAKRIPVHPTKIHVVAMTPFVRAGEMATFKIVASDTDWSMPTVVNYSLAGTAGRGGDYASNNVTGQVTIPAGSRSVAFPVQTVSGSAAAAAVLSVLPGEGYFPGRADAVVRIQGH